MKKKLGIIEIYDKASNSKIREIIVWGSLYKNDKGKLLSGIYMTFTPSEIPEYWFLIGDILKASEFKMSYHREFYGEFYHVGIWGASDYIDMDMIISRLKYLRGSAGKYRYTILIDKDFQYVIDANIVDKL